MILKNAGFDHFKWTCCVKGIVSTYAYKDGRILIRKILFHCNIIVSLVSNTSSPHKSDKQNHLPDIKSMAATASSIQHRPAINTAESALCCSRRPWNSDFKCSCICCRMFTSIFDMHKECKETVRHGHRNTVLTLVIKHEAESTPLIFKR